ncbi:MAG: DNA repair protein RadC [Pseudomonadales bacterium]|nr:MAG: DNA repair protein RadC [Pseudomonadales bacterium]
MPKNQSMCDTHELYTTDGSINERSIITLATHLLEPKLESTNCLTSSKQTCDYVQLQLANYEREVFAGLFLNAQHALIRYEELFFGTIDSSHVWPREVVKAALRLNSAAVIFAHNHPSGHNKPSAADKNITRNLMAALDLVDIRVLDHVIVTKTTTYSMAEHGEL